VLFRSVYLVVAATIMLLVIRRLVRGEFAEWQKATAIVACTLVLPFEAKDYALVHLLLPLTLFAATWRGGRRAWMCAAFFGLLLIPLDYVYLVFDGWRSLLSTATLAYPLLLLGLVVLVLWGPESGAEPHGGKLPVEDATSLEVPG
jgi:hypothetical protein